MTHYPMTRRKAEPQPERWLKTSEAAYEMRMSVKTLSSYRDEKGGPLIEGKHWIAGRFKNSSHLYERYGCITELGRTGKIRKEFDRKLRLISSND